MLVWHEIVRHRKGNTIDLEKKRNKGVKREYKEGKGEKVEKKSKKKQKKKKNR